MSRPRTQRRKARRTKRQRVWDRSGGLCAYCGMPLSVREMTMDHVVPRSKGGESRDTGGRPLLVGSFRPTALRPEDV